MECNDRSPIVAGEVFLLRGQVGGAYCTWLDRLDCPDAPIEDAERANMKKLVEVARRDICDNRAGPAALVMANDMATAQNMTSSMAARILSCGKDCQVA